MNHIIADNAVRSLKNYLSEKLRSLYDERESGHVIAALFQEYLGWSKADLTLNLDRRISESELLKFHFALKRLMAGEPLQYVLGKCYFYGQDFKVNPAVLIPRPETEELVSKILETEKRTAPRVLDIGTGSGCIAISIQLKKPLWRVVAIDVSEEALEIAKTNGRELHAEVQFEKLDILSEVPEGNFDIIVSNPPYIPQQEMSQMNDRVVKHEPALALFTPDENPLIFYRRIVELAAQKLNPGGSVWFEIHEGKKEELMTMLDAMVRGEYHFYQDLQGKDRILHLKLI
jgi:release factor glutamine methyltransferase